MTGAPHATVVAIGGRGVMLAGASGAGKSDLAWRLIDRGALLVADDYADYAVQGGQLIARASAATAGRLELRGVGIVETPHLDSAPITLHVDLDTPPDRLPEPAARNVLGVAVPSVSIAPFEASAPLKIEAALRRFGLPLNLPA